MAKEKTDTKKYTRKGFDDFGEYTEENTGRGWRKLRRKINGVEFQIYGAKTADYIKAIRASEVTLRLNDMSDRIELSNGKPISDFHEAMILNRLQDYGISNTGRMRDAIKEAAFDNKYHPVLEYLEGLKWDGADHFTALMNKLEMSSPLASVFWRKFLIGAIAKAIDARQNFMLVLLGAQGKGKSRLVEWLCPLPHLHYEGPISPDDKDSLIRLLNNWLWEVAELDSTTRRSDRSALKHFVSMKRVKVRVPYGRYDIEKPAAASMIGTINEDGTGFLNDPTGNRRFAVIHLEDIDWSYTDIDLGQLWAQLYAAYKAGEAFELTKAEQEIQNEINNDHMVQSPLEEYLLEWFVIDPSQPDRFMTTMEILEALEGVGLQGDQFRNKMELGTVLAKHKIKRTRRRDNGKLQYGYSGIWKLGEKKISL